jgi:hypothetical protein
MDQVQFIRKAKGSLMAISYLRFVSGPIWLTLAQHQIPHNEAGFARPQTRYMRIIGVNQLPLKIFLSRWMDEIPSVLSLPQIQSLTTLKIFFAEPTTTSRKYMPGVKKPRLKTFCCAEVSCVKTNRPDTFNTLI